MTFWEIFWSCLAAFGAFALTVLVVCILARGLDK